MAKAEFLLDPLSAVMILVVTGVGFLIHIYSIGYMHAEDGYYRFFAYMNLFLFSMLILVLSGNFLMMFVGWEGVGLCSYLLIGYYFDRRSAGDAGKKAFIVNRIGDVGFILGVFLIFMTFNTLNFGEVFRQIAEGPDRFPVEAGVGVLTAIGLLLFVGATGKSAQIPLYVWLPDAMEGPTPVSALIHAATMVTAGVYMVVRCSPDIQPRAHCDGSRHGRRDYHGPGGGYHRARPDGHQTRARLFDREPARLYVRGSGHGRVFSRHFSLDDTCVF